MEKVNIHKGNAESKLCITASLKIKETPRVELEEIQQGSNTEFIFRPPPSHFN